MTKIFIDSIFYSYAQIFFSDRKWFGVLILLATFFAPMVGAMALLGALLSNALAIYLKFDKQKIRSGFYGFNGILIGAAAAYFFQLSPFLILFAIIFIMITFFISASLEHLMATVFNLPGLSLPFILSLYIFMIYLTNYNSISFNESHFNAEFISDSLNVYVNGYFQALGMIVLQSNVIAGIVISLGLLLFSRVMFMNSIYAYTLNAILLNLLLPHYNQEMFLITSLNAVLVSFALGGSLILLSRKTFFLIALSSVFVIVFSGFFIKFFAEHLLPILVLPFNFITLSTIYTLKFREDQSDFVLLYFKPGSPEENYYYHQNRKSRFDRYKFLSAELPFWGQWKVSQGINGNITHKKDWKYAWDFVIPTDTNKEYENEGNTPEDYPCYGTPVVAPLDGEVVNLFENVADNEIGEVNLEANWGNTIVIDHGDGLFSKLSHLKRESLKVKIGDKVKKGEIVAQCGNSGNSPTPHLHFQFQLTDRIDDKTYQFPFAYYLEAKGEYLELKTFDYPEENTLIRNIEVNKRIKKAFNFQVTDKIELACMLDDKKFDEIWEIKVNIFNETYIENDNGDKAYFINRDKIFIMSNYIGKKYSALYYFYLLALRVPYGYYSNLRWSDELPVSLTVNNVVRFFSEFLLMFDQQVYSKIEFEFTERENSKDAFEIKTTLKNKGVKLFSFVNNSGTGSLRISFEGRLEEFNFNFNRKFNAVIKQRSM